jgi:single-strand DNA-binding protein
MKTMRNKVQLIGNLGHDPEIVMIDKKKVAKISLCTTDTYKKASGEKVTETQWHNIIAVGTIAEVIEKYIKKGQRVAVEGKLQNRSYEDKKGVKRYVTEIIAIDLLMLGKIETSS